MMSEYMVGCVLAVGFLCYITRRTSALLRFRMRRLIWVVATTALVMFGGLFLLKFATGDDLEWPNWAQLSLQSMSLGCLFGVFILCLAYSSEESALRKWANTLLVEKK